MKSEFIIERINKEIQDFIEKEVVKPNMIILGSETYDLVKKYSNLNKGIVTHVNDLLIKEVKIPKDLITVVRV